MLGAVPHYKKAPLPVCICSIVKSVVGAMLSAMFGAVPHYIFTLYS